MKTSLNTEIPLRILGHTGQKVSAIGLGGFHIGARMTEAESIQIIRYAIDNGITFMDNCWDYNEGASEIRMGKALKDGYRNKVFLMTKIDAHTAKAATQQLEESMQRLQTENIDLLQFHEVIRMTDPEKIFRPGGSWKRCWPPKKPVKSAISVSPPQEPGHPSENAANRERE